MRNFLIIGLHRRRNRKGRNVWEGKDEHANGPSYFDIQLADKRDKVYLQAE